MISINKNSKILLFLKEIFIRFKESIISVIPIMVIVGVLFGVQYIYLNFNQLNEEIFSWQLLVSFLVSGIVLSFGISIFSLGADLSMSPIGRYIGEDLTKRKSLILLSFVGFLLGTLITIAEPDLTVLADYIPKEVINPWVIKIFVGIGVGIFLVIGILRIVFSKSIKTYVLLFYLIIFVIAALYGDGETAFLELSFDSGGVTTGQITVPFLVSFGIGIAGVKGGDKSDDDSFGLSGLCSIGPIIVVLLLGLFIKPGSLIPSTNETYSLIESFISSLEEVGLAIAPIIIFFIIYDLLFLKLHKQEVARIIIGFIYTFVGLVIFLTAASYGFIPIGKALGEGFIDIPYLLMIISLLIGASIVLAEPSVHILNSQVEEISNGAIKKRTMLFGLSIGVALACLISILKSLYFPELSILYILGPGYALAFILSLFVDDIYVAIAFDSGGIACGSMASAFVMPFIIGVAMQNDSPSNGFGVIGIISMFPIICIELIGVISKINIFIINKRARESIKDEYDMQLITFE